MEKKKQIHRKYSNGFKICVIIDMVRNNLSYRETVRKYWHTGSKEEEDKFRPTLRDWHRKYLEHGEEGIMANRGRPRKTEINYDGLSKEDLAKLTKEELIEAYMYQQAKNEYLKKLKALIQAEEARSGKKPK